MSLKKLLKKIIPYGLMTKRFETERFVSDFLEWKNSGTKPSVEKTVYKNIVSIQGLGYSGSGAVIDLLREYDECFVLGGIDEDSISKDISFGEFDFLRFAGGLYEIEKYLDSANIFDIDCVLNRFVRLVAFSELYKSIPESRPIFYSFFDSITENNIYNLNNVIYNKYIFPHDEKSSIFFLKKLDNKEYRKICRDHLNLLFNLFAQKGKEIMVCDQLCMDYEFDFKRDGEYIDNLKTIIVYRDPRDIYLFSKAHDIEWIAHSSPEAFINWYKKITSHFILQSDKALIVRFEDLFNDYSNVVRIIEDYIGIRKHNNIFKNFNPQISSKNIETFKNEPNLKSDFEKIKRGLSYLCK